MEVGTEAAERECVGGVKRLGQEGCSVGLRQQKGSGGGVSRGWAREVAV